MTDTNLSDVLANAVEAGKTSAVRVEANRCATTTGTVWNGELVVTSLRALRGADSARVVDDSGSARDAEVVGSDPSLDLLLLRVAQPGLHEPRFAAEDALRVGALSLALGRPGVAIRASLRIVGLLSGEFRTPSGGRLTRYVETDRGLPDGFEGGPLIDERGAVIGVNSSSVLRGADLALTQATLARSIEELLAHGRVRRGYLGVATQTVRLPHAQREALEQRSGALVLDTDPQGPAHAAGLGLGDVIVAIDDAPVRGPRELAAALADKRGASVQLRIVRGGKLETLNVTIGERS